MVRLIVLGMVVFGIFFWEGWTASAQSRSTAIPEVDDHKIEIGGQDYKLVLEVEGLIRRAMGAPPSVNGYETHSQRSAYGRLFWALMGARALVEAHQVPALRQALSQEITGHLDAPEWPGQDLVQVFRLPNNDEEAYRRAFRCVYPRHVVADVVQGPAVKFVGVHPPVPANWSESWPWAGTLSPEVEPSGHSEGKSAGYYILGELVPAMRDRLVTQSCETDSLSLAIRRAVSRLTGQMGVKSGGRRWVVCIAEVAHASQGLSHEDWGYVWDRLGTLAQNDWNLVSCGDIWTYDARLTGTHRVSGDRALFHLKMENSVTEQVLAREEMEVLLRHLPNQ